MEELLHIYWIDLTIPGFNYNRSLLQGFSILSAALTAAPDSSVGIVLAPNCGPYGMEYTDEKILIRSYGNLLEGSKNHLRAFVRQIEANFPEEGTYVAQYLSQEEVNEILGR